MTKWKLVPIEPTTRMVVAGINQQHEDDYGLIFVYKAMLEAAPSPTEEIDLRPEVLWFAQQMELKLRENDHKGGWRNMSDGQLMDRLEEETKELTHLMDGHNEPAPEQMIREAADIANFAMMIADNYRLYLQITKGN